MIDRITTKIRRPQIRDITSLNEAIFESVGYKFKSNSLLRQALSHPSLEIQRTQSYERLEFLGDSILNMIVCVILFKVFPDENEGPLAQRKKALICGSTLADVAKEIKLGEYLMMSEDERTRGGDKNNHNLENALEALVGAIYLDGGLESAEAFVHRHWYQLVNSMQNFDPPVDFRSTLQVWAQKRGLPLPQYSMIKRTGPTHVPQFTVLLYVQNYAKIQALGSTIKAAEQEAARLMLEKIKDL